MIIQDVIYHLEELAPLSYAEDFDNVGLLVGNKQAELTGILVTLDTLEAVVDEAIDKQCNLIVSFHPIIFKGLKTLTGKTYVERTVQKAIKNDIAIYAIHTALDNALKGVNDIICNALSLVNKRILIPQKGTIKKLTTYVPKANASTLRTELFKAGAGNIGNYDNCSFNTDGTGTYRGNEHSNPTIGDKGKVHEELETQISVTFNKHVEGQLLSALFKHHPYEEVAFEVTSLENYDQNIGMGMIGELDAPLMTTDFLQFVKDKMNASCIRHSAIHKTEIKNVAVLGGSGSFAISAAKRAGADILITADLKYHDFFSADNEIIVADIGHYESEQFTKNYLVDYLSKKITNFAVVLSTTNTNPVKYF
ncbi:Nif3-like dinuclear metal center hexameric protein [Psychroserpens sp.]|uniref:Nif3-like dinuclear metal center hexameric protein n=1 Tax=Psychroserpens sp. TaxID=2020870 RepID=UPI001B2BB2F8|nr:Nif3-like dinuclear metal center hexameric protein [Psychroserpens sp.]MBO6605949.1 Nif3-like dinuclear metal center hexameric protein [Psychroserpens sp.]MBO6652680.1 Nif3-like dinuclear metal center hexameric protein [Psychroserpens sp.]MBO6681548.1 Nif3-like dinuclear metal center hexameric protein [Psychroserpens sp.]MBO6749323.1 Nif3-like dinuclear metal center hexameric protein [Psychroserpens sp.]MBO6914231.1 Nif3-like dinuclear metal center hexameric protein [Psychroserpens sp.]